MHAIVPPHPGPVAAAEQINADIGLTLLIGIPIAVVSWYFGSYLVSKFLGGTHLRVRGRQVLRPKSTSRPRRRGTTTALGQSAARLRRPCSGCCSSRWC